MTGTDVGAETQAQRIAERGRDALVQRLRSAYGDAAAAHADLISLDDDRIEAMVQSAADRADGLQWRRALADVAAAELGVSPIEALTHPAVARAQGLVGAPSYEQSLAELIARPVPPAAPAPPSDEPAVTEVEPEEPQASDLEAGEPQATALEPEEPQAIDLQAPPLDPDASEQDAPAESSFSDPSGHLPATTEHQAPMEIAKNWPPQSSSRRPDQGSAANELETVEADDQILELLPEPDPIEYDTEVYDVEANLVEEETPPAPEPEPHSPPAGYEADDRADEPQNGYMPEIDSIPAAGTEAEPESAQAQVTAPGQHDDELEVIVPAIHLGGVANLPTKREGLSVRLSADGLDILQGENDILGRLIWDEIEALEVPSLRVRRRHKQTRARLIVRTPYGDASFDVPEISADDLRDRVQPLMWHYGGS